MSPSLRGQATKICGLCQEPNSPCRNPSVTGGYSLWTKVRRKGKGPPWPGGPGGPLGIMRRWFLRGRGGGQGLPPPLAEAQSVHRGYGPPGRCFRRVPPEPPGHNKACTPPLFPEGLRVFAVSVFWMRAWIGGGRRYDSGKHRFFEKMKDSRGFLTIPPGDFLISCFS